MCSVGVSSLTDVTVDRQRPITAFDAVATPPVKSKPSLFSAAVSRMRSVGSSISIRGRASGLAPARSVRMSRSLGQRAEEIQHKSAAIFRYSFQGGPFERKLRTVL